MSKQNCGTCMYSTGDGYPSTYCHRYAPRSPRDDGRNHFPLMSTTDWCGEYIGRDGLVFKPKNEQ